jgi:hypothetical protein
MEITSLVSILMKHQQFQGQLQLSRIFDEASRCVHIVRRIWKTSIDYSQSEEQLPR